MRIIKNIVGDGIKSDSDDVRILRMILNDLGYADKNLNFELVDIKLDKNIKSFQKDNNLKVDGIVEPDGETANRLDEWAARSPTMWCVECGGPHGGVGGDVCPDCLKK